VPLVIASSTGGAVVLLMAHVAGSTRTAASLVLMDPRWKLGIADVARLVVAGR